MKRFLFLAAALTLVGAGCLGNTPSMTDIKAGPVTAVNELMVNENGARGLYVYPSERAGKLPGILVVHEWWGLNDQIKAEARNLAAEGYAVFAIDLYDGEVATDAARAGQLAGAVRGDQAAAERKMKAALDFLEAQPEVNADRLASMGWCFGGGQAAVLSSSGDSRIRATVIYYGTPITDPARLKNMTAPVLGIWGEEDQSIKVADARTFEQALESQGTSAEFHYYEGAGHAFANPTRGDAYRPQATADAWQKTLAFLRAQLVQ